MGNARAQPVWKSGAINGIENDMTLKDLLGATALAVLPMSALAQNAAEMPPCENCSDNITIVSWGGAYQAMRQEEPLRSPTQPRLASTSFADENSNEAVAKLRAQNEAGNVTWDVVDVLATDGILALRRGACCRCPANPHFSPEPS